MNKQEKHKISDQELIRFMEKEMSKEENEIIESWLSDETNLEHFNNLKKLLQHSEAINDFESIDIVEDWEKVKTRIINSEGQSKIRKLYSFSTLVKVAAILVILVGITILIRYYLLPDPEMIAISTDLNKSEFILPDNSKVYLNENSTLTYPEIFSKNERIVNLTGEAYFEVTPNERKSFKIQAINNATIEVLGTSFNINADTSLSQVIVHVTSGKVSFYQTNEHENKTILIKNEKATLEGDLISKSAIDDPNFLSWKTGVLEFKNSLMRNVVDELNDYYKKIIVLMDPSIGEYKYTTTINNQSLEEVLEEITLVFDLDVATRNDTIFILPNQ